MPTKRFLNLPEEKRCRIMHAAAEEFARVPYEKVSINKIIQEAQIPRGSYYQYFSGKQDMLEYMMQGFRNMLLDTAEETLIASGGDPFAVFPAIMSRIFAVSERFYNPEFFRNIYSCVSAYRLRSLGIFRLETRELLERFGHLTNGSPFGALTDEKKGDILDIIIILMHNAVERRFTENVTDEDVTDEFSRKISIIKNCACL